MGMVHFSEEIQSVDDNGVRRVLSILEVRITLEDGTYFEASKKTHVPLQF